MIFSGNNQLIESKVLQNLFFSETIPYKRTVRNSSWFRFSLQNAAGKSLRKRVILERIPESLEDWRVTSSSSELTQRSKNFFIAQTVAALPARAIDLVRGMLFGHTATQFWAFPHI